MAEGCGFLLDFILFVAHLFQLAVEFLALGTATLLYAQERSQTAQAERNAARREHQELDSQLKQVRNEENEIKQKTATFSQLQARGVIGEEQRLDWIELLKNIYQQ